MDAEYFRKSTRKYLDRIYASPFEKLSKIVKRVQHPVEVVREYEEDGLLTLMAKNVRSNRIDLSDLKYMPVSLRNTVSPNELDTGDVLMTRTGANFGVTAPWISTDTAYACADILILRQPTVPTGYLSSFLSGKVGNDLVLRGGYGGAQPHIAPSYLVDMPIPRFPAIEELVAALVNTSASSEASSLSIVADAERLLFRALGLADWKPPEPLSYLASSTDAFAAGRLDAQFFAPRIRGLINHLSRSGSTVGGVSSPRREKFNKERCAEFDYIEISDLGSAGLTGSSRLPCDEAPSRATWHVRPDDIITSMVRPIRRLSAQILPEQDGFVCSSGFVVLQPTQVQPEVLLTFLRLPAICELMDLYASASMYPAISEADILALPFPEIDASTAEAICQSVQQSREARQRANQLLETAKRAVEIAIEDSEAAALRYLEEAGA